MGCAVGRLPRLRRDEHLGRPAAGLPRGPGVRRRGDRLGGRLVTARRRAVTISPAGRRPEVPGTRASVRRPGPSSAPTGIVAIGRRATRTDRRERRSTCPSISVAASSCPTRSSWRRARSATASSTATSSTSTGSARICCKGTTLKPRIGNPTPRVTETPAGMLNSIGLQNPGVDAVIEKYAETWTGVEDARSSSTSPANRSRDYVEVARRLDGVPGVAGIELNISCPNVGAGGLQFAIDAGAAGEVTAAVRRGDRPAAARQAVAERRRHPADRAGHRGRRRRRADRDQHAVRDRRRAGRGRGRCSATSTAACAARRSSRSRCASSTRRPRPSTSRSSPSAA